MYTRHLSYQIHKYYIGNKINNARTCQILVIYSNAFHCTESSVLSRITSKVYSVNDLLHHWGIFSHLLLEMSVIEFSFKQDMFMIWYILLTSLIRFITKHFQTDSPLNWQLWWAYYIGHWDKKFETLALRAWEQFFTCASS